MWIMWDETDITGQKYIDADLASMRENGVPTKSWVAAGASPCNSCLANQEQGFIGVDYKFQSGHLSPLGHPGCKCYLQSGEISLDLV